MNNGARMRRQRPCRAVRDHAVEVAETRDRMAYSTCASAGKWPPGCCLRGARGGVVVMLDATAPVQVATRIAWHMGAGPGCG